MILTRNKKETTILTTNHLPSKTEIYLYSEKSIAYIFLMDYITNYCEKSFLKVKNPPPKPQKSEELFFLNLE